jgi:two-component system cell cycle sensor histidine kinase/response regulator CckA
VSEKEIVEEGPAREDILMGTETILLVDDEDAIIEIGRELLARLGYRVIPARSGEQAVEIYRKGGDQIDLVILDMIMPGMGGGDTYDQLREIDPLIRVLLSSGYSIDGQAKTIIDRGCNGFLQKPFTVADLSKKIRQILEE